MPDLVSVKFRYKRGKYNSGEVAGFKAADAARLIKEKYAEPYPSRSGAVTKAPAISEATTEPPAATETEWKPKRKRGRPPKRQS